MKTKEKYVIILNTWGGFMQEKQIYSGKFILHDNITLNQIRINIKKTIKNGINIKITNCRKKLTTIEESQLSKWILSAANNMPCNENDIFDILVNIKYNNSINKQKTAILYEKVYDKNGNAYAKEILTGFIFPLLTTKDLNFKCFYSNHIICNFFGKSIGYNISNDFFPELINRKNFQLCECYCIEDKPVDYMEIASYKSKNAKHYNGMPTIDFGTKIFKLYNMNLFDDSEIINTQSDLVQSINNPNNISSQQADSYSSHTNEENNFMVQNDTNSPIQTSENSSNEQLELLKKVKEFLPLLPDEDINLIKDLTNNNLEDPDILKYMKMPREEKLAILSSRLQQSSDNNKPKVSLKKKR